MCYTLYVLVSEEIVVNESQGSSPQETYIPIREDNLAVINCKKSEI